MSQKEKKSQRFRWYHIIIYFLCYSIIVLYSCICESIHDICFMLQYHFYAFFLDRFLFFFVETEIDDETDAVVITFVENCVEIKTIAIVMLINVTILIENGCIKTSMNLNVFVKDFLSRRVDNLLINAALFFLINSRCSNFFIKFKQLFKYDINFYSLNFEL